jgi:hypothetical protein
MTYDGLERIINGKIKNLKDLLETSTYGEIKSLNSDSIDVLLPQRNEILPNVPVFTLQGNGEYIQFPLKVGDKVLISFTKDSALDWLSGNDISSSFNFGLENAFALVGLDTLANPLPLTQITTINVTKIKIQNDTAELITTLSNLLEQLIETTKELQLLTVTTIGIGSPTTVPNNASSFYTIEGELTTLKSEIDSFKY